MNQAEQTCPITVLIPTRDIVQYLPLALASVVAQGGDWHVVGVDSASTDGTRDLWADFAERYPNRVTVLDEPDCRLAEAVNVGLVAARPGLVQWIGGDDRVHPGAHEAIRAARATHPKAGWFCGHIQFRDESGDALSIARAEPWNLQRMLERNRYFAPATIYDRHFAIRSGLTSPAHPRTMDYEWWFRMALLEEPVVIDAVLADFMVRAAALSGGDNDLARTREVLRASRHYAETWADRAVWTQAWARRWVPLWARTTLRPTYAAIRSKLGREPSS